MVGSDVESSADDGADVAAGRSRRAPSSCRGSDAGGSSSKKRKKDPSFSCVQCWLCDQSCEPFRTYKGHMTGKCCHSKLRRFEYKTEGKPGGKIEYNTLRKSDPTQYKAEALAFVTEGEYGWQKAKMKANENVLY